MSDGIRDGMSGFPEHIPEVPRASMFLYDPLDEEQTRLTRLAHRAAQSAILEEQPVVRATPVQFVQLASGETIVWEVHGQASWTANGRQGLRPERVAMLRQLNAAGYSVLIDFVEGAESYWRAWLHDLPEAQPITHGQDGDRGSKRFGWKCADLEKIEGRLVLPTEVPPRKARAQEALV